MLGMSSTDTSIWEIIYSIWKFEGVRGFYKGILPNVLKVMPSMSSSWISFELTRDFLIKDR